MSCPLESRRLAVPGGHDAECPGQGEEGAEAGCSRGGNGLHSHGPQQALGGPAARRYGALLPSIVTIVTPLHSYHTMFRVPTVMEILKNIWNFKICIPGLEMFWEFWTVFTFPLFPHRPPVSVSL